MTRNWQKGLTSFALFGVGVFGGLVLGLQQFAEFSLPFWAIVLVIGGCVAGSMLLSWYWWKRLDEVSQEAHKFAWYWGGSAGLATGLLTVVFVDAGQLASPLFEGRSPADGFVAGALTIMMAQIVGCLAGLVQWVVW